MEKKLRILFLPKWYPNRYDPMPGLFIQRQAEAITPFCDVAVIYVHPDPDCPNKLEVDFSEENQVRVLRVYYQVNQRKSKFPGQFLNVWNFYRAHLKAFHSIREFAPDIVHAHILTRMGFIGWKIAKKQNIPLVISEHWSRYFPENKTYRGWLRKLVTRFIVKRAAAIVAVSGQLQTAMRQCGLNHPNFKIVPNVVDTHKLNAGHPGEKGLRKIMVHISCFDDKPKNISGFLRSVKDLSDTRQDFTCLMVGEGPDLEEMKDYARFLRIPDDILQFTGLKTGHEFAAILNAADFSVLSSRYETFGTVVIESLAYGVPVVATKAGVAVEVISEVNGLLVPPGDEKAMTGALNSMVDQCREYDKTLVMNSIADKYTGKTIGNQLVSLYRELIS